MGLLIKPVAPSGSVSATQAEDRPLAKRGAGQSISAAEPSMYDRSMWLATIGQTGFVLANTLVAHYVRWLEFLGGDVEQAGYIMAIGSLFGLAMRPLLGRWILRFGARTCWAFGYVIFGISAVANLALYELSWWLYVLRSGLVLGSALVFTSSLTYVSQTTPAHRRAEAIGVLGAGGFIGMLTGPYIGDLFLGSGIRTRENFVLLFGVAGVLLLLPLLFLWFLKPVPVTSRTKQQTRFFPTVRRYWPGTIVVINLCFGCFMAIPFVFLYSYIDHYQLKTPILTSVGVYFLGYAGWGILVRLTLRRLPDQIGRRRVLLVGMSFMTVGLLSMLTIPRLGASYLLLAGMITGTGHALSFQTMTTLVMESFPDEVRGTGATFSLMLQDTGMIVGQSCLGLIAKRFGYPWVFIFLGICGCVATTLFAVVCLKSRYANRTN